MKDRATGFGSRMPSHDVAGGFDVNIHPYLRRLDRLKLKYQTMPCVRPVWSSEQSERLITPGELDQVRRQNN
jgi:hypothetical protein